jgi:hypothetical protein
LPVLYLPSCKLTAFCIPKETFSTKSPKFACPFFIIATDETPIKHGLKTKIVQRLPFVPTKSVFDPCSIRGHVFHPPRFFRNFFTGLTMLNSE